MQKIPWSRKFNYKNAITSSLHPDHSRPQSSCLLHMTDGDKNSGEPRDRAFSYLMFVKTMESLLIGQSETRLNLSVYCEVCPGLWWIECMCFMEIKDHSRNHNMGFRTFLCLETKSEVSEQLFSAQMAIFRFLLMNANVYLQRIV